MHCVTSHIPRVFKSENARVKLNLGSEGGPPPSPPSRNLTFGQNKTSVRLVVCFFQTINLDN